MTKLTLQALARPAGGLGMVAMDQRESLRAMLAAHQAGPVDDAALRAFKLELGPLLPSLYKAQVPHGTPAEVAATCDTLTATLPVPWVVLSQGVTVADFPTAVEIACRAGASGFLAGRAIWSDTIGTGYTSELLRTRSVDRLRRLGDIVDRNARPWAEVG
jgi:sulfofructosephosphate aldolase